MSTGGIGVLLGLMIVCLLGLCVFPRRPRSQRFLPPPHDHRMILNPNTHDRLSCMFCPLDQPLPSSAPKDFRGLVKWCRKEGLLWGSGGVSQGRLSELYRQEPA